VNSDEALILKEVLKQISIRKRTGELGVLHGTDRFASNHTVFRKQHLEVLDTIARKLGLNSGVNRTDK
jgi:hypothetical protein